jgi:hypothetical protein
MRIRLLIIIVILAFLSVGCNQTAINIEDLNYEDIINGQYGNPEPDIEADKVLWKKIINDNEAVLFYLNKDRTISASRIACVNGKWKAFAAAPSDRSDDEAISWQWSLISNPADEDKRSATAVIWGYIYSSEVEKVLVGSDKEQDSFEKAQIIDFEDYGIKVYYFLTDDDTGFEYNAVAAYDNSGNTLFTNKTGVKNAFSNIEDSITNFAWEIINRDIANYELNPNVNIIDSKLTRLELVETFDALADSPIQVYALEYRLLPEDLSKVVMAGGMSYDEEGWLRSTASMGSPLLVITHRGDEAELIGIIWTGEVTGKGGMEKEIRDLLERNSLQEKRAQIEEAIVDYYENTGEPIIIYEQIPFEDGTLVLAEKLMDGEHYPDLHFVDGRSKVTYHTRGSYCWTLNYTQFKGHYIYFGLAGIETRQYVEKPIQVESVEAIFPDRTISVLPKVKEIARINPSEKDTRIFKNPQGYIMPVKGRGIPEDFIFTFQNGERKSISKMHIERSIDHMPDYLKSKKAEVYNSYAFTFTPMLTPAEWHKGYRSGEICLEGKTDHRGNRVALHLRPAGHMSLLDSFIIPQDIKPLYLSDNYIRTTNFSAGETVALKYPEERELLDCRILKLTVEMVENEIGQDSLEVIGINEKGQLILPKEKGYYLFLLRTVEDKEVQTYTGMVTIKQD